MRFRLTLALLLLPLLLVHQAGAAAPARSADRLECALALVPPQARSSFAERYGADKSRAELDDVIPASAYRRMVEACLDPGAADLEKRAGRLGQAVMSWHLMTLAKASLVATGSVPELALDEAYRGLSSQERAQLTGEDPTAVVLKLTGRVRPDLVGASGGNKQKDAGADAFYLDLIEDVAVYAASRALLDAVADQY